MEGVPTVDVTKFGVAGVGIVGIIDVDTLVLVILLSEINKLCYVALKLTFIFPDYSNI